MKKIINYLIYREFTHDKDFKIFENENCKVILHQDNVEIQSSNFIEDNKESMSIFSQDFNVYWLIGMLVYNNLLKKNISNKNVVGKFIIVEDLKFTDYMKDNDGNIKLYNTLDDAALTCGMYEFPDALILEVKFNHVEK